MRLDRDSIQSLRTLVLMAIRLLSVLLIVAGLVMIGNRLVWAILAVGDLKQAWGVWNSIGAWHGIYLGLPMVLVGGALGGASSAIAWWAVRPSPRGCAACGYSDVDGDGRCTECGYR